MSKALLPGSYDPISLGHIDIIKRASLLFDEIYVVIMDNPKKEGKHMFTSEERLSMINESLADVGNAKIITDIWHGMLVDYAKEKGIKVIVKGIRNETDYAYECNMARINKSLYPQCETLFISCKEEYTNISSSLIREYVKEGKDISALVPYPVFKKTISE